MSADPTPVTVAVAPTLTTVVAVDVRAVGRLTLQVQNLDPTQTCSGFVTARVAGSMGYSATAHIAFHALLPAGSVDADGTPTDSAAVDVECGGLSDVALQARMSGAGGSVRCALRKAGPK